MDVFAGALRLFAPRHGPGIEARVRTKPVLAAAVGLVVLASLWYVQAPPRSAGAYRERALMTVETLRSQVQTTRIWLRALADDESTRHAAKVGFREAEEDAHKAASAFERYDPPTGTDALRTRLTSLAGEVTDSLGRIRIAAHRGEWRQLQQRRGPLAELSRRLEALKQDARS